MGKVELPHLVDQITRFGVLDGTDPIGAMSMASRVGNQLSHLCKMLAGVTGNFLEGRLGVRLANGWQIASRVPK